MANACEHIELSQDEHYAHTNRTQLHIVIPNNILWLIPKTYCVHTNTVTAPKPHNPFNTTLKTTWIHMIYHTSEPSTPHKKFNFIFPLFSRAFVPEMFCFNKYLDIYGRDMIRNACNHQTLVKSPSVTLVKICLAHLELFHARRRTERISYAFHRVANWKGTRMK